MNNRRFFNVSARGYDWLTDQPLWHAQVARALDHAPPLHRIRQVLDIGCGPGGSTFVLAEHLPQAQVVGIDVAERMVARARGHHARAFGHLDNVGFRAAGAASLPLEAASFDLVVGHSFLYLVADSAAVLAELRRIIAPGGALVLMEPRDRGSLRRAARRAAESFEDWRGEGGGDLLRFGLSMVLWRVVSGRVGQLEPDEVGRLFDRAGFDRAYTAPTLGGLGMHCVGLVDDDEEAA